MRRSEVTPHFLHSLDPSNTSGVLLFFYLYNFMQVVLTLIHSFIQLFIQDFTLYLARVSQIAAWFL